MDLGLGLRASIKSVVVILSVFMLQGCSSGVWNATTAGSASAQQTSASDWSLIYANRSDLYVYENGKTRKLAQNPAGYKSLDHWIGYSSQLNAVVFYRFLEDHFRLLDLKANGDGVGLHNLGRACSDECNPHDYALHDDKLWVVRGVKRRAELWSYDMSGKWERTATWNVPKTVPVPQKWSRPPAISGSTIAFVSPSDYLLVMDTNGGSIRILRDGDRTYHDPGYEDSGSGELAPIMSPEGKWVFYKPASRRDLDDLTIVVCNCATGAEKTYRLSGQRDSAPLLGPPSLVGMLHWIPGTDLIACEVQPRQSGMSYVALLNTSSGSSDYLPVGVERYQWCIVGAVDK